MEKPDTTDQWHGRRNDLRWVEDFNDMSMDDLRELPNELQLGLDLSIFD